jgi:hypothetical protein
VTGGARPPLLLYLASGDDPQRLAVGPALAAVAERAGWGFECYYDSLRRGRHYGGGDPARARAGMAEGGLVAGAQHAERTLRLAARHALTAVGDPDSPLWAALVATDAVQLLRSADPAELYAAVYRRLEQPLPERVLVLDGRAQGPYGVTTAPFLYPALLSGPPALGVEACADRGQREALERLGAGRFEGLGVAAERAAAFPGGLDGGDVLPVDSGWTAFTVAAARRHRGWGRGVLVADPEAIAGQLPKARRLRLLPVHGRPAVEAIESLGDVIRAADEPVFGRQWDDRDFFALAQAGHGLQVIDPGPPFDAAAGVAGVVGPPPGSSASEQPTDEQLERWADEGRILCTLLFWSGMVRELDCVPRLIDLVAETDVHAGLVVTAESVDHGWDEALGLIAVPRARGGVLGRLDLTLGSTGRGVAAESLLPPGALEGHLRGALDTLDARLPSALRPRGWWPLLDARLVRRRERPVEWHGRRPVVRAGPRVRRLARGVRRGSGSAGPAAPAAPASPPRGQGLREFVRGRRPYDGWRPAGVEDSVIAAVRGAGLEYMWTKSGFGTPTVLRRDGDFVVLPFTAGNWDGWSPFYTAGHAADIVRAERRLRRRARAGWLATTIDSPLFALSGEIWENGRRLHEIVRTVAGGGASGELVNATPDVVARYARLLAGREPG